MPEKALVKYFRLCLVFQAVHTQAGRNHKDQYGKYRGEELLAFAVQHFCNQFEGIIVGIDPEQPEYPHDPQHSESHRSGGKEDRQIIGQKGKHVHNSGKGKDIFPDRSRDAGFGMSIFCRPHPEKIVQTEHGDSNVFQNKKQVAVPYPVFFICIKNTDRQIQDNGYQVDEIINTGRRIRSAPYFKYFINTVSELFFFSAVHNDQSPTINQKESNFLLTTRVDKIREKNKRQLSFLGE